jgi:hypothetical protein
VPPVRDSVSGRDGTLRPAVTIYTPVVDLLHRYRLDISQGIDVLTFDAGPAAACERLYDCRGCL